MDGHRNICVFAASSERLEASYRNLAEELGGLIAAAGAAMVFGAGATGLMGAAARGVDAAGGSMIGVIPERLNRPGVAYENCTRLIVTPTMHERKQTMEALSDAFIALPGGFGTLEEVLEVITLKQLGYHQKPIVLINQGGFFDALLEQFELLFATGSADIECRLLYDVANTAGEAFALLKKRRPLSSPGPLQEMDMRINAV